MDGSVRRWMNGWVDGWLYLAMILLLSSTAGWLPPEPSARGCEGYDFHASLEASSQASALDTYQPAYQQPSIHTNLPIISPTHTNLPIISP